MWEFVKGCQWSNLLYFPICFWWFRWRYLSCISLRFCICFVKPKLGSVGGCRLCDLGMFYNVFSLFEGLGRASQRHILHFRFSFINVSGKLMWEFVKGCQCSNLLYVPVCFWWFRWRYLSCIALRFCRCFVKPHLASVGGCQLFDLGLFYIVFSLVDGFVRANQRHILHFRLSFIDVS